MPLAALATTGCGLSLKMVDASVRKPSNVAIYFRVTDHDGKGVPDLPATQFNIFEDGKPVPPEMSKQTILSDKPQPLTTSGKRQSALRTT